MSNGEIIRYIGYLTVILVALGGILYYGKSKDWGITRYEKFMFSILISLSAGGIGSIFTIQGLEPWYQELTKPWFAPPGEAISVIWIILYVLMGISLYIILTHDLGKRKVKIAIGAFAVQLAINASWSYLFFGIPSLLWGLVGIIVLWFAVGATIYFFDQVSEKASFLLLPYILWVSIALLVNISLYILN